ncbi:MAG TPA: fibronectin type III domain-containing protein [Candidatus Eisenbacteria bacterium]|nr:fibronectin type III domain-containing protein [Candidatus Eisenbacteria bacterium]
MGTLLPYIPAEATTCPTSGLNVTIAANCIFDAGTYTFTGTLTINAGVTVTAASNVGNAQVVIVSDNINVQGTVSADGTGLSSGGGTGTSTGTAGGGAHGGDGGDGSTDANSGGNANDSVTAPVGLGGAGGDDPNNGPNATAPGAGSIKLSAPSGTITIGGTVTANGTAGDNSDDGGGAGGSVWIDAGTLAGTGTVRALGGANFGNGGGGGGGRIAIYYTSGSPTSYTLQVHSAGTRPGGAGTIYLKAAAATNGDLIVDNNNAASNSSSTTTQVTTASQTYDNVTIRNAAKYAIPNTFTLSVAAAGALTGGGSTRPELITNSGGTFNPPTATFAFTGIDVTNNGTIGVVTNMTVGPSAIFTHNTAAVFSAGLATLTVGSGGSGTFTQSGTGAISVATVTVASGGIVNHGINAATKANEVNFSSTTFDVQSGGQVNLDGLGYTSGTGVGASTGTAGGGAHGGDGGDGSTDANSGGNAFDSVTAPTDLGGAGGDDPNNGANPTQQGAGAAKLVVSGTFTNNGTITANGVAGDNSDDGGGAGGSVWIDAGTLAGTGIIRALGGANFGNGGGGGGGRIAITYTSGSPSSYTLQAHSAGTRPGGAGTIFTKAAAATNGDLVVDNNNNASVNSSSTTTQAVTASQTFDNVTVRNGAKYAVPSAFTLTVAGAGAFVGGGTTRPEMIVNGGGTFNAPTSTFVFTGIDVTNNGAIGVVTDLTVGPSSTMTQGSSATFSAGLLSLTVGSAGSGTFAESGTGVISIPTLTVASGGILNHVTNSSAKTNVVNISSTTINILTGGQVNVDSLGYTSTVGTGTSTGTSGGGAHGGDGGDGASDPNSGANAYDSLTAPADLGGAGGDDPNNGANPTQQGGGAVKFIASGTFTNNGTITANGAAGDNSDDGGGAGGSVWIDAGTLAGTGIIRALGGANAGSGGGGGGGRIAILYTSGVPASYTVQAHSAGTRPGGAGTIFFKSAAQTNGDLILDNNDAASNAASTTTQVGTLSQTFDNITVRKGAKYVVPSTFSFTLASGGALTGGGTARASIATLAGGLFKPNLTTLALNNLDVDNGGTLADVTTVTLTNSNFGNSGTFQAGCDSLTVGTGSTFTISGTATFTCTTITVQSGGTFTHAQNTTSRANVADVSATTFDLQSGGTVNVQGKGFQQGSGPGAGTTTASAASGGGYGGNGGNETFGSGAAGGATYGSVTNPTDIGSGGGNAGSSGNGGGALKLVVSGTLTINGTINANGNNSSTGNSAGGSGGSVWIDAGTLAGTGTITSTGGNGTSAGAGGSGAGGGRIAIFYASGSPSYTMQAFGGTPGSGGSAFGGGAGTIYLKSAAQANGDLLVDNNNMSTTNSGAFALTTQCSATSPCTSTASQTYDNVTIRNAAKYIVPNGSTLTVSPAGALTGGGAIRPILTINSGAAFNPPTTGTYTLSSIDVNNAGSVNIVTNLTLTNSTFTESGSFGATLTDYTAASGGNLIIQSLTGLSLANVTAQSGGSFTSGTLSQIPITTLTVQSGGTITHSQNTTAKIYVLDILATTVDVQTSGTISVLGKGFQQGSGPGTGSTIASAASGGGYGGKGGDETFSTGAAGGATYGSVTNPVDIGSGGGNGGTSGNGGGAIKLTVSGTLTVNGTISANGNPSSSGNGAGGSGGSAWITAGTLAGSGTISSNGGNGTTAGAGGSGAGGGRIAVFYTTDSSTIVSTAGKLQAYGGTPGSGGSAFGGGAGSVFVKSAAAANGDLIVDNNNMSTAQTGSFGQTVQVTTLSQTYDNVTVRNAAKYTVPNTFTLTVAGGGTFTGGGAIRPSLTTNSGGTFNPPNASQTFSSIDVTNGGAVGVATNLTLQNSIFTHNGNFSATVTDLTFGVGASTFIHNGTGFSDADLVIGNSGTFVLQTTAAFSINSADVQSTGTFESRRLGNFTIATVTVRSGGTMTHTANTTSKLYQLDMSATTMDVQASGTVAAVGRGFQQGSGTGTGTTIASAASGGGYGGKGGDETFSTGAAGGAAYGSVTNPVDLGSGGGNGGTSGNGGGAIKLTVSGTLTVNGTISANGNPSSSGNGAGGSGGSAWLAAGTLAGSGTVSANGGVGTTAGAGGSGGGGGRVAVFYTTDSSTLVSTAGKLQAYGANPGSGGSAFSGGAGSVYVKSAAAANGDLVIDNNNNASTGSFGFTPQVTTASQTYDNITIRNGAKYSVPSTFSLAAATAMTVGTGTQVSRFESQNVNTLTVGTTLTVASNGLLTHSANTTTKTAALIISAASVNIQSGGSINVAANGYASGSGTGAGGTVSSLGAGGGGHGGAGGSGTGVGGTGGSTYDSSTDPTDLGSGGGKVTTSVGGAGGGQVTIVASGTVTINGAINATGGAATNTGTGGGSGGTIRISGFTVEGSAALTADGAAGQGVIGGCGGGGRIAINYTVLTYSGTASVAGACPASGARTGANGTYVTTQDNNPGPGTTSISPNSAIAGSGGFTLTVNGSNFVPSSVVRWGGSDRTTTYVSSTQLTAAITSGDVAGAGVVTVTVFNPLPGGGSSNGQTFTVNNPVPTTTSVSPTAKNVGDAGFTLTVNGTNFVPTSVVRWDGSDRTTTFVNSTQVTAAILTSDLAAAGTFTVTVFDPTPGGGVSNGQTFTVNNNVPTTTSISPDNAIAGSSSFTLTVNGTNFVSTSVVRWNGGDRTTTFVNANQVTASISSSDVSSTGSAAVTVFNPTPGGGTSNSQTFSINNPAPTTTSIVPVSATAGSGAFTLTVNGTNFIASSVVRWEGADRTTTFVNSTQLTAAILGTDITTPGTASVTVFNPTPGGGLSNAQTFTINSSGGGGGGPPPDTAPPVITNVSAVNVTAGDARIIWDTDEAANSKVNFGPTASYGRQASEAAFVTSHGLTLSGLDPSTTYHYQACSTDTAGNQACSTDATFTTLSGPDSTGPVISNVAAASTEGTSARVTWDTDEAASSFVDYGPVAGPPYNATAGSASPLVAAHDVSLTDLAVNTLYHFRVRSADAAGNESAGADGTFTTAAGPDVTAPVIAEARVGEIADSTAAVLWTTDEAADASVEYGTTTDYGSGAASTDPDATDHRVALAALAPDTVYHARARSKDAAGNEAVSADLEFRTAKPAPPRITDVAADQITTTSVRITWTTDIAVASRVQYGTTIDYQWTHQDLTPKTAHALIIGALAQDTTYHFRVRADDAFGQTTFSPDGVFTTLPDRDPPGNVRNLTAAPDTGEIRLEWQNPSDADLRGILIVRRNGVAPTSTSDGTRVFNSLGTFHLDAGLQDAVTYYYRAFAYDTAGNYASGVTVSATTPIPCRDTDGQDHAVRGTVTTSDGAVFTDVCIDEHRVEENYCSDRKRVSAVVDCGLDRVCEAGRCVAAPVPAEAPATCGNGTCDTGETEASCSADCAAPPTTPEPAEVPPGVTTIPADSHLRFYLGAGGPEMSLSYTDELEAVPNMMIRVYVPDDAVRKPVQDGYVIFAGKTWPLRETRSYEAVVTAPSSIGIYPMTVVLNYTDGTADAFVLTVAVGPPGVVFEKKDGKNAPVQGAKVSLLAKSGGAYVLWSGGAGSSANPQITGANGSYSFFVPAGTYKLRAEKAGYATMETLPFDENGGFLRVALELVLQPKPLTDALKDALSQGTVAEKAGAVANAIAAEASYEIQVTTRAVKEFADNPIVEQQTEDVAAPTVAAIAAVNVASGAAMTATAVPYLLYLMSFLAHPTLLIARRRRKKWGIVYNALTKLPLDLAIVRLIDAKTGRIVRSSVTDKDGRYFFIVPPGEYKLIAIKAGYAFPTTYLRGQKQDVTLVDLYHGEDIKVEKETTITANIPLDPVTTAKTPAKVLLEGLARKLQTALAVSTVLAMVVAAAITPTPKVFAILAGNIAMFLFFRRLSATKKPRNWGIVYDDATGKPVQNAVARIFDTKYNKLLETQVTDARGRYAFLVGNNVYYVTFEKPGYQKQQKGPVNAMHVDKKKTLEEGLVAVDVRLPKAEAKPAATAVTAATMPPPTPATQAPPAPPSPPASEPAAPGPVVPTPYQGVDTTGPPRDGPPEGTGPPERAGPAGPAENGGAVGERSTGVVTGEPPKTSSP